MTKRKKIIIITVASILAVAVIVGLVFLLTNNSSAPGSATPTDVESSISSEVDSGPSKNVEEKVEKIEVKKDATSITVENIEAKRGKEISVPIILNNNPGIAASAIEFLYNTDKLTYTGYEEGEVFEDYYFFETKNSLRFSNIENGDSKKTGVMFTLKFKVKEDAVLGDTEIKVNINDESFANFDEEFVKVEGGNAAITIK